MARFAGSVSLGVPNYSRSAQSGSGITPWQGQGAGNKTAAGNAANTVSVGNLFGSLRKNSPNYSKIAQQAAANRSAEKLAGWEASANMTMAGVDAAKSIAVAEEQAKAYEAQASAASLVE